MANYCVYGLATATVTITVEADSPEEALEKANDQFGGVSGYAGNGGMGDKLIGVSGWNETIQYDDSPEFTDVEEV